MKSAFIALLALVCLSIATPAHAWNCSNIADGRVDVGSTKPAGATAGDGPGQYYIGPDATNPNDYYVCEPAGTPPPATTGGNSNASSTSNSASNSSSQSASKSQSTSSATGGNSASTSTANGGSATGGNATAVGGNSSAGISNSGNSSVSNNVTASGGQGGSGGAGGNASSTATGGNQKQSQNQTLTNAGNSSSTANGNGVGNGNNSNDTTINEPREVASAYAPSMNATAQCFKPFSGGGQGLLFGASFGGGKIDENCARLEASRQAPTLVARCKVFITSKYAKEAHVTLDDCLPKPVVVVAAPSVAVVAPVPTPVITINVPPTQVTVIVPPVPTPAPSVAVAARIYGHTQKPSCVPTVPKGKNPCRPEVITNDNLK
jgi:hypothetical protein